MLSLRRPRSFELFRDVVMERMFSKETILVNYEWQSIDADSTIDGRTLAECCVR